MNNVKSLKTGKRLNLYLDANYFEKLEKVKEGHGDNSYTQAIKRAIALLDFIDDKREQGLELFLGDEDNGKIQRLVIAP